MMLQYVQALKNLTADGFIEGGWIYGLKIPH